MFSKIKKTFKNHASGKQQSEDGVPLLTKSEQHGPSHQGTRQYNKKASHLPFLSFNRRQNEGDSRNHPTVQETRIPQTPQYAPSSPPRSPRRSKHSSSRSIQSNENGRPSTSTRSESVVSRSSSHHTTSTNMNSRVMVPQGRSSRNELRPSPSSRDEPRSSIPRSSITVEQPIIISSLNDHHTTTIMRHTEMHPRGVIVHNSLTGDEFRPSSASRDDREPSYYNSEIYFYRTRPSNK